MKFDKREALLDRLHRSTLPSVPGLAVDPQNDDVPGSISVYRDRGQISGLPYPFIVLLDGDDEYDDTTRIHQNIVGLSPQIMDLKTQVWLFLRPRDTLENRTVDQEFAPVGPEISLWRNRVYGAVRDDATLEALCTPGGQIRFGGMKTDMQTGGQMLGQLLLMFTFKYTLRPSDI